MTAGKSLTAALKLRGKGIAITPFNASVCSLDQGGGKCFLFQLFPNSPAAGAARSDAKGQSVEINLAQKQKLDCALQLTRTVALDRETMTITLTRTAPVVVNDVNVYRRR